ncbi:Dyp-type peroxidase domain-containing protein [Microbispora sp. CA-102843]|uniref:Dyp-type peroxidase domain-containing protein n=1 Tax=Microbispora sp. CA-102843 TaxID=3239952 RepID=UPI003D94500C
MAWLMRLLTDDARRLTQGRSALADTEPELAPLPARLTVTFGFFGPGLFAATKTSGRRPAFIAPLPTFRIDPCASFVDHGQRPGRAFGAEYLDSVARSFPLLLRSHQVLFIHGESR